MFEQSILAKENPATKTKALAASFGLQALILAVGLLIPLIFGERMPGIQLLLMKISAPALSRPEPAPVTPTTTTTSAPSALRAPTRAFPLAMVSNRAAATVSPTVIGDADAVSEAPGVIGEPGGLAIPAINMIAVAPPKPEAKPAPILTKPIQVGGDVQAAKLIRKIVPEYPVLAKNGRISGTVRLTSVISKDGKIEQLEVLSGNPLLIPAALAAVKQWLYRPTYLNGQPVEVIAPIDVIFRLSQ